MARLPYVRREDIPQQYQQVSSGNKPGESGSTLNIHRMMAHCPHLLNARFTFGMALNRDPSSQLDPIHREMATLTIGRMTKCSYEYHHHVERALKAGMTEEQLMAMPVWEHDPLFSEEERAVIRYAEETTRNIRVLDSTFDALRSFFTHPQIVELTVLIAHYNATVRFLEALEVRLSDEGGV